VLVANNGVLAHTTFIQHIRRVIPVHDEARVILRNVIHTAVWRQVIDPGSQSQEVSTYTSKIGWQWGLDDGEARLSSGHLQAVMGRDVEDAGTSDVGLDADAVHCLVMMDPVAGEAGLCEIESPTEGEAATAGRGIKLYRGATSGSGSNRSMGVPWIVLTSMHLRMCNLPCMARTTSSNLWS